MNTTTKRAIALVVVTGLFVGGMGCELLVDFDRTKIDAGVVDGSFNPDGPMQDQMTQDTNPPDVAKDSPQETGMETGMDTGMDVDAMMMMETGPDGADAEAAAEAEAEAAADADGG